MSKTVVHFAHLDIKTDEEGDLFAQATCDCTGTIGFSAWQCFDYKNTVKFKSRAKQHLDLACKGKHNYE